MDSMQERCEPASSMLGRLALSVGQKGDSAWISRSSGCGAGVTWCLVEAPDGSVGLVSATSTSIFSSIGGEDSRWVCDSGRCSLTAAKEAEFLAWASSGQKLSCIKAPQLAMPNGFR